jgi:limonene 1,2-monooxygenase
LFVERNVPERLRFGVFLPPYHRSEQNPTLALHRDLELIELWERLGFDEVWVGEHHSGGVELIASPEQFLAAAAMRTRRIKLGTGVVSLPYHHPFMVAQRIVLLDHLSHGRAMLGVGPGALPLDASMLGIEQSETRLRLEEGLMAILALLEAREPVSMTTDWFTLDRAHLHLAPFNPAGLEIAVAAAVSPSGPRLAGKYGCGLLSVGATSPAGFEALRGHWEVMREQAELSGRAVDRSGWRLAGPMHIAETREQAERDVEYGLLDWARYFQHVGAVPQVQVVGDNTAELIEGINAEGVGVIGTAEDAIAQIRRLLEQSGGFGCYMLIGHDWAAPEQTARSHELFARLVMPEFQGAMDSLRISRLQAMERFESLSAEQTAAIEAAKQRYESQRAIIAEPRASQLDSASRLTSEKEEP